MITFAGMNYRVTSKEATIRADEFVRRYRDVERISQYCLQCPGYGKAWNCPPFDFDPRTRSDGFKTVKLIGTIIQFDEQTRAACTTPEQATATGKQAIEEVCRTLLPSMYKMEKDVPGSRCFTFRCMLCPEGCTRSEGNPCRHPEKLRHSLESVGFDIEAMTREQLEIDLEWSRDGSLSKNITLVTALFMP